MKIHRYCFIIVALFVAACSSKPKPTATPVPTPTDTPEPTPTPLTRPPDGTYTTSITKEELIDNGMSEQLACENAGVLAMALTVDKWTIIQTASPGCTVYNPEWGGSLQFNADQVTFHDDTPFGCSADYTYKWFYTGSGIRFSVVDDSGCDQRIYYMTKHPWVKEK